MIKIEVLLLWMFNGFFDMCFNGLIVKYIIEKGGRYDRFFWSEDLVVMNLFFDFVCKIWYMCYWCCGMLFFVMFMFCCFLKVLFMMGLLWGFLWLYIRGRDICDWVCDDKGECCLGIYWCVVFNMGFEKLLLCWVVGFY